MQKPTGKSRRVRQARRITLQMAVKKAVRCELCVQDFLNPKDKEMRQRAQTEVTGLVDTLTEVIFPNAGRALGLDARIALVSAARLKFACEVYEAALRKFLRGKAESSQDEFERIRGELECHLRIFIILGSGI